MKKVLIASVLGLAAISGAHQVTVNGHAPKSTTIKSPSKGTKVKTVTAGKKKRHKFLGIF